MGTVPLAQEKKPKVTGCKEKMKRKEPLGHVYALRLFFFLEVYLIRECHSCRERIWLFPCSLTYRMPSAAARAAAIVVM